MASLNKVMIIGNLGKDPEMRSTAGGTSVCNFPVATTEKFKNKAGESEERTEWHNVVLWSKLADVAAEYLTKGKSVYIEGRIQTRKWEDKDGKDRYTTEIVGDTMQMLGSKGDHVADGGNKESKPAQNTKTASSNKPAPKKEAPQSSGYEDDDIPF